MLRDLFVSGFIIAFLPTAFRRPFIGLLLFTLLAYMRVQDLTWGFARYQRWSFYVAGITLAGFFFSSGTKRFMLPDPAQLHDDPARIVGRVVAGLHREARRHGRRVALHRVREDHRRRRLHDRPGQETATTCVCSCGSSRSRSASTA